MTFISVADVPEILRDWNYDLNTKPPAEVPIKSIEKRLWTNSECGHTWTEYPRARYDLRRGCLVCCGKQILPGFNDFKTLYPEIISKIVDGDSLPDNLNPHSGYLTTLICEREHLYDRHLKDIVRGAGKCPICLGKKILTGFNDLASRFPDVAAEFHPLKNGSLKPENISVSAGSIWWICSRDHEWQARVDARTGQNQGCPYCSGSRAIPGETDLHTKFPKVSADWDYTLNGDLDPTQVKPLSHKFVWWKCPKDHSSYRQQISKRTGRGTECPECSKGRGNSKGEYELAAFIASLGYDYIQGSRKFLQGMEVDLFIQDGRRGLEYNGERTHCDEALKPDSIDATYRDYHLRKLGQADATSVDLVFVWEHDWEEHRADVESAVIRWFESGERTSLLERLVSFKDIEKDCCTVRV